MRQSPTSAFELVGLRDGALYEAIPDFEVLKDDCNEFAGLVQENTSDMDLWHERLAHLGYDNVRHMYKKGVVNGMTVRDKSFKKDHFCDACASAKATMNSPRKELSSYRVQPGK